MLSHRPQPLHRAVRTRADTTGALLRALGLAVVVVGVLLAGSWLLSDNSGEKPPPVPVRAMPGDDRGSGGALVLPAAPADAR